MGPFGTGLAAKLARNLVTYGSWLAAYEAQRLAEAAGIVLADLAKAIRVSDAQIGGASTLMFRRRWRRSRTADDAGLVGAMRAASHLAHKDLTAALELARSVGSRAAVGGDDRGALRRDLRARPGGALNQARRMSSCCADVELRAGVMMNRRHDERVHDHD